MSSESDHDDGTLLKEGDSFANVCDAKQAVQEYGDALFVKYSVNTNNKTTLKFFCKHGGRKRNKKEITGERIHRHYNYMGCKASIN